MRAWALGFLILSSPAQAALLGLDNGDRISGDMVSYERGKVKWQTAFGGTVKVALTRVVSMTTDTFYDVEFDSGRTWRECSVSRLANAWDITCRNGQNTVLTANRITSLRETRRKQSMEHTGQVDLTVEDHRAEDRDLTARIALDTSIRQDIMRHSLRIDAKKEIENSVTVDERRTTEYQLDYYFLERWYAIGLLQRDREKTDDDRVTHVAGTGLGYEWINLTDLMVATEVALGHIRRHYDTLEDANFNAGRLRTTVEYVPEVVDIRLKHEHVYFSDVDGTGLWQFQTENSVELPIHSRLDVILKYLAEKQGGAGSEEEQPEYETSLGIAYRW